MSTKPGLHLPSISSNRFSSNAAFWIATLFFTTCWLIARDCVMQSMRRKKIAAAKMKLELTLKPNSKARWNTGCGKIATTKIKILSSIHMRL